jgi:hypothetical protein
MNLIRWCVAAFSAVLLAGCAFPGGMPKGTSIGQMRSGFIKPTEEFQLPGGITRLEFMQGAFGRETFMLDFDADGKLIASNQVLTEGKLLSIQPGESEESVRMRFGRPVQIDPIGWQKRHVLDYRYQASDCIWFRVSIDNATGQVTDTGPGPDPVCDGGPSRF